MRLPQPVQTLEGTKAWMKQQMGPTLSIIVEADGGDLDYVMELLQDGRKRQKPRHRALLAEMRDGEIDTSGIG